PERRWLGAFATTQGWFSGLAAHAHRKDHHYTGRAGRIQHVEGGRWWSILNSRSRVGWANETLDRMTRSAPSRVFQCECPWRGRRDFLKALFLLSASGNTGGCGRCSEEI